MRSTQRFFIALLCVTVHTSVLGQASIGATTVNDFQVVQPVSPRLDADPGSDMLMEISGWGERFELQLEDNRQLLERLPASRRDAIRGRGDRFLRGTLADKPDSWVRVNWIDGKLSGAFFDGRELYLLDQAGGFALPTARAVEDDATLLMRFSDLQLDGLIDHGGVPTGLPQPPPSDYGAFVMELREFVRTEGMTLLSMPVTIVVDTFFQDRHGANTESVTLGRVNFVDGIFANHFGVGILLWHYEALTDNGTLTSSDASTLLTNQFRSYMTSGAGADLPFQGLAHLFTGRDLDGNTVGIAYLNVLCSSFAGYGVNQNLNNDTTSSLVFAHELGHNYSAPHTDAGIMQARLSNSQEFADDSVAAMSDALGRADCLVDGGLQIFEDSFE